MPTTLKFPQDLLRFLFWIFFKPITLDAYINQLDSSLSNTSTLITLWRHGRGNPELRSLVKLTLLNTMIAPCLIGLGVAIVFALLGMTVNWISVGIGIALSIPLGVAFCEVGGILFGVTISALIGLTAGVGDNLLPIVSSDTWIGVIFGLIFGTRYGSSITAWGGLIIGLAFGVAISVVRSMPAGIAVGMFCIVCYYRLFLYIFELPLSLCQAWFATFRDATTLLRISPIYWDELIWFPLFGLDQHLIAIGKHNRQAAQKPIADVTQSFRQQWAARNALIELTAYDVERAQNAQAIANIAEQFAWLPPTMPKDLENVLPPIRDIAAYAQAALESDTLYNQQTQLRNAIAQTQRVRAGLALSSNRQIAARFGRALETWEQVLGKELSGLDAREVIPNVYVAGSPLATASKVFKGRHDLFVALERELTSHAEQRPTLLLFGARRSGKTSAIKQMPVRLGPDVIPVEVDLQSAATAEDVRGLLFGIADQIKRNALTHRRVQLPTLTRDELRADPYVVFGDWLNRVEEQVGNRWILLNLDEYEKLSEMIEGGRIDARVFDFLRGIIQHHPRVTVLLSGSHTIEDMGGAGATHASPLLSDYLINVRVLKIENLKESEARELIVQPIENFPLQYEPAAVERILAVTGCQPFLLQATCRDLVNQLNEQNRITATQDDADRALESVLTTGVAYFQDLWSGRDSDDAQRAVMRAIATNNDVGALHATPLQNALRKLVHRDVLTVIVSPEGAKQPPTTSSEIASSHPSTSLRTLLAMTNQYRFRVELVRRWVERQPV